MDIGNYRKFDKFCTQNKDEISRILKHKLNGRNLTLSDKDLDNVFQQSYIALYNNIEKKNLKTLDCKGTHIPIFAKEAYKTLRTYFLEICFRQSLKYISSQTHYKDYSKERYKAKIVSMASDAGMSEKEFDDMLAGYSGLEDPNTRAYEIEIDGEISAKQYNEILNVCAEIDGDNSEKIDKVHQALNALAKKCKDLLWRHYVDEYSWALVACQCGLKNADTAKVQGKRCRERFEYFFNGQK